MEKVWASSGTAPWEVVLTDDLGHRWIGDEPVELSMRTPSIT